MQPMEVEYPETPLHPARKNIVRQPRRCKCKCSVQVILCVVAAVIAALIGMYFVNHLIDGRPPIPIISLGPMFITDFPVGAKSDRAKWNATLTIDTQHVKAQAKILKCSVTLLYNEEEVSHTGCSNKEPFVLEANGDLEVYVSSYFDTKNMWQERVRGALTLEVQIKVSLKEEERRNQKKIYLCDEVEIKFSDTIGKTLDVLVCN